VAAAGKRAGAAAGAAAFPRYASHILHLAKVLYSGSTLDWQHAQCWLWQWQKYRQLVFCCSLLLLLLLQH